MQYRIVAGFGCYSVISGSAPDHAQASNLWPPYFSGSFADCWAWIQYIAAQESAA